MIKRATSILAIAIAALTFGGITGVASAQSNGQSADQQKAQQLQQQYRQKAMKLQQIHEKTLKANPQLKDQQQALKKQIRDAVEDQGYDVDKGSERVQAMAKKLKSKDLSDAEKKATMKDFRAEQQQMIKARNAAMQKPEIQKSIQKLQSDTLAAMKKQDSQTEDLLNQMQSLRAQLRKMMPAPGAQGNNG